MKTSRAIRAMRMAISPSSRRAGAHLVFAPRRARSIRTISRPTVSVAGPAKAGLEDKFRPQFFDGVATIVAKLLYRDRGRFRDVRREGLPAAPHCLPNGKGSRFADQGRRRSDGAGGGRLALSSRNPYLSKAERHQASAIYRVLAAAAREDEGRRAPSRATAAARRALTTLGFRIDYVAARNPKVSPLPSMMSRRACSPPRGSARPRLIDNVPSLAS